MAPLERSSYRLRLSARHLLLLDYIARQHSSIPQCARQIADGPCDDQQRFYSYHSANSPSRTMLHPRSTRTAIRKQIQRIREELARRFDQEDLPLIPKHIVRSEQTSSTEVRYWVDACIEFEHN